MRGPQQNFVEEQDCMLLVTGQAQVLSSVVDHERLTEECMIPVGVGDDASRVISNEHCGY